MSRIAGSSSTIRMRFCTLWPLVPGTAAIRRRFGDGLVTSSPAARARPWLLAQVRIADALATELEHHRRDRGDAGVDAGTGVVIDVVAPAQVVELHQRLLGTAAEIGGLRPGFTGAHRVAGDLAGAREAAVEYRIFVGAGHQRAQDVLGALPCP